MTAAPRTLRVPADYYQQFDADFTLDVPGEGYGGWKTAGIEISLEHTAVVVMHAWDCGTREQYPGWHRAVEYIPRAGTIARTVFPPLLDAIRRSPLPLFHVVGGGEGYEDFPGHKRAVALAAAYPAPPRLQVDSEPVLQRLQAFRNKHVFVGPHNVPDVERGFKNLKFFSEARPMGDEGIAENGRQLFALCKETGINHLIYMGFAINWCLLLSPGGMAEMNPMGIMCSAFRQAVTAVENRETARKELCKEEGLWRTALSFGFVFDVAPFIAALKTLNDSPASPGAG
ncbi:MAG: hypothetical protein HY343_12495 [Lentisphaerae bacterium]|nr:hypothetical protein [Lentisphaerota bacterium]